MVFLRATFNLIQEAKKTRKGSVNYVASERASDLLDTSIRLVATAAPIPKYSA